MRLKIKNIIYLFTIFKDLSNPIRAKRQHFCASAPDYIPQGAMETNSHTR